jgi:hypothetical protein
MTEIGIDCALNLHMPRQDRGTERPEIVPMLLEGRRAVPQKGGALLDQDLVQLTVGQHSRNDIHSFLPRLEL